MMEEYDEMEEKQCNHLRVVSELNEFSFDYCGPRINLPRKDKNGF